MRHTIKVQFDVEIVDNKIEVIKDTQVVKLVEHKHRSDVYELLLKTPHPRKMYVECQGDLAGATVLECAPSDGKPIDIAAISSKNKAFETTVQSITRFRSRNLLSSGPVDPAFWNTPDPFMSFDLGMCTKQEPIEIIFETFGKPEVAPLLKLVFWGL